MRISWISPLIVAFVSLKAGPFALIGRYYKLIGIHEHMSLTLYPSNQCRRRATAVFFWTLSEKKTGEQKKS